MASPHLRLRHVPVTSSTEPPPAFRPTRLIGRLGTVVLLTATAGLGLTLLPGSAGAAPGNAVTKAGSAREATELVADAQHHLEAVSEQVNDAQVTLAEQQAAATAAGATVTAAQDQVAALDGQMRQIARSAFTGDNFSRFNALMTSGSADEFLAQVSTIDTLAGHTTVILGQVDAAAAAATEAKTAADTAAAAAQQTLDGVTAQQAVLETEIADYRAQYDRLSATEQVRVNAVHAGPVLTEPADVPAPTASAQTVVDTALAQIGDPYVWGAGGPNSFDCSGLTQYAYAAAGVSLPHSSRVQATMGTAVPRAQLEPGDLVFFYSPVSHVGMYIGNGQMVHAATFGSPVQVTSVDMKGYAGARRFAG